MDEIYSYALGWYLVVRIWRTWYLASDKVTWILHLVVFPWVLLYCRVSFHSIWILSPLFFPSCVFVFINVLISCCVYDMWIQFRLLVCSCCVLSCVVCFDDLCSCNILCSDEMVILLNILLCCVCFCGMWTPGWHNLWDYR